MSTKNTPLGLLVSLAALGIYGYSLNYMIFSPKIAGMSKLFPPAVVAYGHLRFLTFQCLLMQTVNALLHVGAFFMPFLRGPRDVIFASLAYPIGSVVVYTFWAVWHLQGREVIFPVAASQYYPDWLNHATHTVIVPINFLLLLFVNHKWHKNVFLVTMMHQIGYMILLNYIKYRTGVSVYGYLDKMSDMERGVYMLATGALGYIMYKSGQYLNGLFHKQASQKPAPSSKKAKQK